MLGLSPLSKRRKLTLGISTPLSLNVNGRILTVTIRPAPECLGMLGDEAEPVSR